MGNQGSFAEILAEKVVVRLGYWSKGKGLALFLSTQIPREHEHAADEHGDVRKRDPY